MRLTTGTSFSFLATVVPYKASLRRQENAQAIAELTKSMKASIPAEELQRLIRENGDLGVTVSTMGGEYSTSGVSYAEAGPLTNLLGVQRQSPANRFVIEAKDNIT